MFYSLGSTFGVITVTNFHHCYNIKLHNKKAFHWGNLVQYQLILINTSGLENAQH